jgi:hypothetical protein
VRLFILSSYLLCFSIRCHSRGDAGVKKVTFASSSDVLQSAGHNLSRSERCYDTSQAFTNSVQKTVTPSGQDWCLGALL